MNTHSEFTNIIKKNDIELDIITIELDKTDLTKLQKSILLKVYKNIHDELIDIIDELNDEDIDNIKISNSILNITSICIKYIEKIKVNKRVINGNEKKIIVIELGRIIIKKNIENSESSLNILNIYNLSVDIILENIISVSRVVNTLIKKKCNINFCCS
tara:strand:+ start:1947 stop:2423 length:477 start_codon:yes stop_codon:yes gene_type:complete